MTLMHFKIGDSADTMRLLCGAPIKDACWTNNPRDVTCTVCYLKIRTQSAAMARALRR